MIKVMNGCPFLKDEMGNRFPSEKKLLKKYGKVEIPSPRVKIMFIADTHGLLDESKVNGEYDACILLGDHTYGDIEKILNIVPKEKLYGIRGNHDYDYLEKYGIRDINGVNTFIGVRILGMEGSFSYKKGCPGFNQQESVDFLQDKGKTDLLVTHDGPYRTDMGYAHQGLYGITEYIYREKIPYHVHGHTHIHKETEYLNGCKRYNLGQGEVVILEI